MVIKVMVADDQALIRESLKIILSAHPDIEVVATVEDGNHVLSSIPQTHPDLILMDIRMPPLTMMNLSTVRSSMVLQVIF